MQGKGHRGRDSGGVAHHPLEEEKKGFSSSVSQNKKKNHLFIRGWGQGKADRESEFRWGGEGTDGSPSVSRQERGSSKNYSGAFPLPRRMGDGEVAYITFIKGKETLQFVS